jgi:gliding motility-associated-like protein
MKSTASQLLLLIVLFLNNERIVAQNTFFEGLNTPFIKKEANNNLDSIEKKSNTIWIEDTPQRTLNTSYYTSNDGQIKTVSSKRPINYFNFKNELIPIKTTLTEYEKGIWSAQNQPYPTYLFSNGSFSLTVDKNKSITLGKNCSINGISIKTDFDFSGNSTLIEDVISGIDKQLIFYENAVKYNYILKQPFDSETKEIIFSEEINLPKGYKIEYNQALGKQVENGWMGELIIKNLTNEIVANIQAPICIDANNNYTLGAFRIRQSNDIYILEMVIQSEWLNNSARNYPIIIDPLVTGPTTTWNGGNMPSCLLPSYNQDSILVTIPGGITVTGLYVTASFYADPFTPAIMSQGSMFFSTDCSNSQTFTIVGTNANLPGTGYLDSFNLFNPLTCCFPESCNSSNFYLSMHLGRTGPGTGCNTSYIRYDAFTTLWPFQAVVVGKTAETYGGKWVISQVPICSNKCTITGNAYVSYGVPPFTYSHPWTTGAITQGQNIGCNNGANYYHFTLDIPNCPNYCDTNTNTLTVPPPVIIDACGTVVSGIPSVVIPLKTAPELNPIFDNTVCSNTPFSIDLNSCIPAATANWWGNNSSGTGDFSDLLINNSTNTNFTNYSAVATVNGCSSDTLTFIVNVDPNPSANYTVNPELVILNLPAEFTDVSTSFGGSIASWNWTINEALFSISQNETNTFSEPGIYEICLSIMTDNGCLDSICKNINAAPAEVNVPNVVTVNGDNINDLLIFEYLEFYPDNHLVILNRWGTIIYEKDGYLNDWNGKEFTEGVYFYQLKIDSSDKMYIGFFQLVK